MNKNKKCVLCPKDYEGFGNNALPVKEGMCCDLCNSGVVIPARFKKIGMAILCKGCGEICPYDNYCKDCTDTTDEYRESQEESDDERPHRLEIHLPTEDSTVDEQKGWTDLRGINIKKI